MSKIMNTNIRYMPIKQAQEDHLLLSHFNMTNQERLCNADFSQVNIAVISIG